MKKLEAAVDQNKEFTLPDSIKVNMSDGSTKLYPVIWKTQLVDTTNVGTFTYSGKVAGYEKEVFAVVTVKPYIVKVDNIVICAYVGDKIKYPETVKALMSDGTTKTVHINYKYNLPATEKPGTWECENGIVDGYDRHVPLMWVIKKNRKPQFEPVTENTEPKDAFPSNFLGPSRTASYKSLDTSRTNTLINIIASEMTKYPTTLLDTNLDSIFIYDDLYVDGIKYGGTWSNSSVLLTDKNDENWIKMEFDHEFNHMLHYRYINLFDEKGWRAANHADFVYGNGGKDALSKGLYKDVSLEYSANSGFVSEYAKSGIKEDIATTSEYLFSGNSQFWSIVENNATLKEKVRILIDFYNKLDPFFTEEYFKGLKN